MQMELQKITKENIEKVTGIFISDMLKHKPVGDVRLKKLKRHQVDSAPDFLIRGNPQLTMGRITKIEDVDAYFDGKEKCKEKGE